MATTCPDCGRPNCWTMFSPDFEDKGAAEAECLAVQVASLRTQLAAATERYERAVALHEEVRKRLVTERDEAVVALKDVRSNFDALTEVAKNLKERLDAVRAAVIECAYCNGVGAQVCLPGDVVEPCPACGGLRAAVDPEGTAARLAALTSP